MDGSKATMNRIKAHVVAIAKELNVSESELDASRFSGDAPPGSAALRLVTAKAWQRASEVRRVIFGEGDRLFADPAWEVLLDLYIQQAEGRVVNISSACLATKVPLTTGLRWLNLLREGGLIERTADPHDRRRTLVSLTPEAIQKIGLSLDAAAASDRRLGLGRLEIIG
ncbi:winged helix DNA-binding protein [Sphingomonas sp. BIUV-7]|uniref:Winged helix DNA-binding protein n=1 Tax=Sphingomonas natans TaxID=3063330 RepID=A0ABT8YA03_9SPHN|nr:winged helix DNA-binding protein [Sphingomonas sp. BIUV-7]MDO6415162.1 winged helix DNA-binding protein [Sphingomonas sp. BIUV-7]